MRTLTTTTTTRSSGGGGYQQAADDLEQLAARLWALAAAIRNR